MKIDSYQRPGFTIGQTHYLFRKRIIEELKKVGSLLNPEEAWLLMLLEESGGSAPTGALRNVMMRDPSTLTRQLDHACEKELVRRECDKADGRVINVILTPKGRRELTEVMPGFKTLRRSAVAGISKENLRIMTAALLTIQDNLKSSST